VNDRIRLIDALRGVALAGIALVHFGQQYVGFMPPPDHRTYAVPGIADKVLEALMQIFVVGKGFGLFSLMFGLSFALQMQRAERRAPGQDFRRRFAWRLTVLLGIGYLHSLVYAGDILTIYALLGVPLVLFYRVPDRWLLAIALVLLVGSPRVVRAVLGGPGAFGDQKAMAASLDAAAVRHWQALESGDLTRIVADNATAGMLSKWDFQMGFMGRGYQTFALFLIGLWIGRRRLFENVETHRLFLKRVLRWTGGLLLAVPLVGVGAVMLAARLSGAPGGPQQSGAIPDLTSWPVLLSVCFYDTWNNLMTLFYVAAFALLFLRPRWQTLLVRFAPIGQMALTSYLLQTVIGAFLFFGFGLGLLGRFGNVATVPIGLVVVALQTWLCPLWLTRFRYGPVEWAWRSLTWLRRQPFRLAPAVPVVRVA
jgi:uncharacterized protein